MSRGNSTNYSKQRIIHKSLSISFEEETLKGVVKQLKEIVDFHNKDFKDKAEKLYGQADIEGVEILVKVQKNKHSNQSVIKRLIQKEWDKTVGNKVHSESEIRMKTKFYNEYMDGMGENVLD